LEFKTSNNLIDLLVGRNLYSNPNVAMRELLQNAEDACYLQSLAEPSFAPEIVVRYSSYANWVEIEDNGLGMDREIFEESFATIGASKTTSPKLQALISMAADGNRPIGQFGIGVLSCFGVADSVEVRTRADGTAPLSVAIPDRHRPFEESQDHRDTRGTTLRLRLKSGGPMQADQVPDAVAHYVRHARYIWLENVDSQSKSLVPERWLAQAWDESSEVKFEGVEEGHLQLSNAWDNIQNGFGVSLVLCNGGFLVSETAAEVLPQMAIGFIGEIDIKAGALSILMSREGFQHDERWTTFVAGLAAHYRARVAQKLDGWLNEDLSAAAIDRLRAIQRVALLILSTPMSDVVGPENVERAFRLAPDVLLLAGGHAQRFEPVALAARAKPPLYAHSSDDRQQQSRSFSDGAQNFTLTESISSSDLRMSLLRLNGFAVVRTERHDYNVQFANGNQTFQIHDFEILTKLCGRTGISLARVLDAPSEHTLIGSSPDAEAVADLMQLTSNLKIQSVETMADAIIADFNGYILNANNADVRRILRPDLAGKRGNADRLCAATSARLCQRL
jgi:hypothetical protein